MMAWVTRVLCTTLSKPQGNFTLELYFQHAPRTCHNFAGTLSFRCLSIHPLILLPSLPPSHPTELARSGYYNGTIFHRIIKVGGKEGRPILLAMRQEGRTCEAVYLSHTHTHPPFPPSLPPSLPPSVRPCAGFHDSGRGSHGHRAWRRIYLRVSSGF